MKKIYLCLFVLSMIAVFSLAGCDLKGEVEEESITIEESTKQDTSETINEVPSLGELQWRWQNPLPDGNALNNVWCSSPNDVFAVGTNGTIKHYDGSTWSEMESGTTSNLNRVWASSSSDVFTVGENVILHYDGSLWQSMDYEISGCYFYDVWGSSPSDVFVSGSRLDNGTTKGIILHYDGSNWDIMTDQLTGSVSSIWGSSPSDVYAVSNEYIATSEQFFPNYASIIYHYDGQSWNEMMRSEINDEIRGDTLRDIWGTSPNDIYAVGERLYSEETETRDVVTTVIYHYDGDSWTSTTSVTGRLYGVWGSSPSDIYAVMGMQGRENIFLYYDGNNWNTIRHDFGNYILGVHGTSSSDIFMVGRGGLIVHYDESEWNQMSGFGTTINYINSIWGASSTDVYAVGGRWDYPEQKYYSMMLHYDGSSWSNVESKTDRYIYDIWGASSTDIFYVGRGGIIKHYNGKLWTKMFSGVETSIYGIWGSSSDVFAVGQNGLILHYDRNSNNVWTKMTSGTDAFLYDVWGSSPSDVFAVGYNYNYDTQKSTPVILYYDGTSWSEMETGITSGSLSRVGGLSSTDVFAIGGNYDYTNMQYESILLHYDGSSWSKMDNEALEIRVLNGVWGSSSPELYAVGQLGNILHYDGESWIEIDSGAPLMFSYIWGTSSTDIFATTGQDGTILHYSN